MIRMIPLLFGLLLHVLYYTTAILDYADNTDDNNDMITIIIILYTYTNRHQNHHVHIHHNDNNNNDYNNYNTNLY